MCHTINMTTITTIYMGLITLLAFMSVRLLLSQIMLRIHTNASVKKLSQIHVNMKCYIMETEDASESDLP